MSGAVEPLSGHCQHVSSDLSFFRDFLVCQEGAIVRNGIDIDRAENVGSLEMGEVVRAYDRCVNSSGVLRYQTARGWVSELTRGPGRENIAELISVSVGEAPDSLYKWSKLSAKESKRVDCGIPDLRSVSAAVLSRMHTSQVTLFGALERVMVSGIRPPPRSNLSSNKTLVKKDVMSLSKSLSVNLQSNFDFAKKMISSQKEGEEGDATLCMYHGNQLSLLLYSLTDTRETLQRRSMFNLPVSNSEPRFLLCQPPLLNPSLVVASCSS